MAMSKFVLKTLPGIDRPAIASFFPTLRGESVMLDLGANLSCDADNLVQFAVMGRVFARTVLGILKPTVGLLNVGSEEVKGHEAVREAFAILRASSLPGEFHGFVEGDDIARGTVDVIVTDGFTGNVALKDAGGNGQALRRISQAQLQELAYRPVWLSSCSPGAERATRSHPIRAAYNGAIFLGLNGVCRSTSHAERDALRFCQCHRRGTSTMGDTEIPRQDPRGLCPLYRCQCRHRAGRRTLMVIRLPRHRLRAYLPAKIVTNAELAGRLRTSDEWIAQRTGIRQRHIAAEGEMTSDLATAAVQAALKHAGVSRRKSTFLCWRPPRPITPFRRRRPRSGQYRHDPRCCL